MLFTISELLDIVIMTAFIGFIFKDVFKRREHYTDPLQYYQNIRYGFNWGDFWFACGVTAPAIILHELSHKFVAMSFGFHATFHAAYTWLVIGLVLKLMNFGLIFFVPAYVSYPAGGTPLQHAAISIAGPLMNLIVWLVSGILIRKRLISRKYLPAAVLTNRLNFFLFLFNMIPIPPFDGGHFFLSLIQAVF